MALTAVLAACGPGADESASADVADKSARAWQTMTVKASSYTLDPGETRPDRDGVGAFGETLSPTERIIAVSRDLLNAGLTEGTQVRIEGLKGTYTVLDKMHRRWREKIDILFAKRRRALN